MNFRSYYDARKKKYKSGEAVGHLEDTGVSTRRTGTFVQFKPDASVFSETEFDLDTVEERLRQLAFLNKGVEITLVDERLSMAEALRSRGNFGETEEESGEENAEENTTETAPFLMPRSVLK